MLPESVAEKQNLGSRLLSVNCVVNRHHFQLACLEWRQTRKRLRWVEVFLRLGNYSVACLKRGISRPALRKWVRRYQAQGNDGLSAESGKP
jgi:hypothetical protein